MRDECWSYLKTVVDTVREPILILDKDLSVVTANEPFYKLFQVNQKQTEGKLIYKLGNGQWNIPALKKLLETILPKNTFFKDFEVVHKFPFIGNKLMILNAQKIHTTNDTKALLPSMILIAIEDTTPMMAIAETLAAHMKELAIKNNSLTDVLQNRIRKLEKKLVQEVATRM